MQMCIIHGQNVYTHSGIGLKLNDLLKSKKKTGEIVDAYFCELERDPKSGFREAKKITYDPSKIAMDESGLMISIVNENNDSASTPVAGLEAITSLLSEANIIDFDVSKLKGRKIIEYGSWELLYGFALDIK
ncbi:MAG: hypothetical protein KC589_08545 [Nanoarchaeota archaeon]|nr:hypothetical protein [Nanoarchaeota archaeon]